MRIIICGLSALLSIAILLFGAMLLKTQLYDQLWTSLRSNTSSSSIQAAIDALKPELNSTIENLHSQTLESLSTLNGKPICLRMMIQDIFEPEFYTAAITKPGKIESREELESNIILNKYWSNIQNEEEIHSQQNKHIILDRELYRAIIPKGQTSWVTKLNGGGDVDSVILKCYHRQGFKLGQIVSVIGILDFQRQQKQQVIQSHSQLKGINDYYPIGVVPRINVISVLDQNQAKQYNLDYKSSLLKQQFNYVQTKESLLKLFEAFSSSRYAQFLLYSLVNTQRMSLYLSGENLEPLLKHLLPFLVKVQVTIPFKQQIFPKKNDIMRDSLLQLSDETTYVIIDFTNIGEGKLQGQEVINLELLKKFAEDGEILYKWQIGQSLINKHTSGIVAKAPTIIEPTFNLKNESINLQKLPSLQQIKQSVQIFRAYIHQVRNLSQQVLLSSDSQKTLIQKDFVQQRQMTEGKLSPETFSQRLLLCRLQAALAGSTQITHKIYQRIKEITK